MFKTNALLTHFHKVFASPFKTKIARMKLAKSIYDSTNLKERCDMDPLKPEEVSKFARQHKFTIKQSLESRRYEINKKYEDFECKAIVYLDRIPYTVPPDRQEKLEYLTPLLKFYLYQLETRRRIRFVNENEVRFVPMFILLTKPGKREGMVISGHLYPNIFRTGEIYPMLDLPHSFEKYMEYRKGYTSTYQGDLRSLSKETRQQLNTFVRTDLGFDEEFYYFFMSTAADKKRKVEIHQLEQIRKFFAS